MYRMYNVVQSNIYWAAWNIPFKSRFILSCSGLSYIKSAVSNNGYIVYIHTWSPKILVFLQLNHSKSLYTRIYISWLPADPMAFSAIISFKNQAAFCQLIGNLATFNKLQIPLMLRDLNTATVHIHPHPTPSGLFTCWTTTSLTNK